MFLLMTTGAYSPEWDLRRARLGDLRLQAALHRFVRGRLKGGDAEDVVQDTLADALEATRAPEDSTELRKWVFGIARRKVADHWSRRGRHAPLRDEEGVQPSDGEVDAVDLVRWAQREIGEHPEDQRTLRWMVREGLFGETLASIAAESGLPAAQIRQRVSRLRRVLRSKWAVQLGLAALTVVLLAIGWSAVVERPYEPVRPDGVAVLDPRIPEATKLRNDAEAACSTEDWVGCERSLDEAKAIDPDGERAEWVMRLRNLIVRLRTSSPAPLPTTAPAPTAPPKKAPAPDETSTKSRGAPPPAPECPCTESDPMCGCLPGMGRSVVP
jgi:DNA-directed RNA polymerase specialized sigma24 family protein